MSASAEDFVEVVTVIRRAGIATKPQHPYISTAKV
jgi:hypothetical protein